MRLRTAAHQAPATGKDMPPESRGLAPVRSITSGIQRDEREEYEILVYIKVVPLSFLRRGKSSAESSTLLIKLPSSHNKHPIA
jgi:hypothetical protein